MSKQIETNERREASMETEEPPHCLRSPVAESISREEVPTPAARRLSSPARPTPKAGLRHDDSQIEFAVIESSPTDYQAMESQLLTEHQKEVRSQQQAQAAAMFPDIRSSTDAKARPTSDLRKQMNGLVLSDCNAVVEEPTTPSPSHGPIDDFLCSSPTPGSSAKRDPIIADEVLSTSAHRDYSCHVVSEYEDPPSSPPEFLNKEDETSARRYVRYEHAQTKQCHRKNVSDPSERNSANTFEMAEDDTHADLEIIDSFRQSSTPSLRYNDENDDIDFRLSKMGTCDGAHDDRLENELQKQSFDHGDNDVSQPQPLENTAMEVNSQEQESTEATSGPPEIQSEFDTRGPESDAFVDAPSVLAEKVSELVEEPEIFVDASQGPLDMTIENVDRKQLFSDDGNHAQTSEHKGSQDLTATDQPSSIKDSFVMEAEQLLPPVSQHNPPTFEGLTRQPQGSQLAQTNDGGTTRGTNKRKRGSQDTINARRPMKRRMFQPLQPVDANVQVAQEDDDIQDCITVLRPITVPEFERETSTPTHQPHQSASQSTKKRGWPPKSIATNMDSEIGLSQRKRKVSSEVSREDIDTDKFWSGESGVGKADPDDDDSEIGHHASNENSRQGSRMFSHVEIETSQHSPAISVKPMDANVDELPDTQSSGNLRADDTYGENVSVGGTDDINAAGCTAGRINADDAEASQQLVAEQRAAQAARRIAQPKSIIERLRGILADCRGAVFGSRERLELYDTLAEVHAAVRKRKDDELDM